jgi:acyl carrier protein
MYVLDARGQPVPVGVRGEIYIGGPGVARGYLNRPEQTQERFLTDKFAPGGQRMYRTGDLGRWNEQGCLEFLGRNDDQVKIRGFRIELGEIEAQLLQVAGVRAAVVVAREDSAGDQRLVAYIVSDEVLPGNAAMLRARLSEVLPEHMVPAAYVELAQLPLTPTGKVDRRALAPPQADAYAQRRYLAPVGEMQQALARLWSELLGVEQVGAEDDFFELGGHSLLVVQLVSRVRAHFQVDIAIREIFEHASLRAMADVLTAKRIAAFSVEDVAQVSVELERLSADELRALLAEERAS